MTQFAIDQSKPQYDWLYASTEVLWDNPVGRMVQRAAELINPGTAIDLGCGEGRNAIWLARRQWRVVGVDLSSLALSKARRIESVAGTPPAELIVGNVADSRIQTLVPMEDATLVLAYGLYHCLRDDEMWATQDWIDSKTRPGTLVAFAGLNSRRPLPEGHLTGELHLRTHASLVAMFRRWRVITCYDGDLQERHGEAVPWHTHSITWAIFERERD